MKTVSFITIYEPVKLGLDLNQVPVKILYYGLNKQDQKGKAYLNPSGMPVSGSSVKESLAWSSRR